eukprot:10097321-Heterocapsa_arctica.AAC.1
MEVFRRAEIPDPWMQDKVPLETPQDLVLASRDEMRRALAGVGIVPYLDAEVDSEGEFSGFTLKGGRRWELTLRKFWKITLGLRRALRPGAR